VAGISVEGCFVEDVEIMVPMILRQLKNTPKEKYKKKQQGGQICRSTK
jgi:hypothetical protein